MSIVNPSISPSSSSLLQLSRRDGDLKHYRPGIQAPWPVRNLSKKIGKDDKFEFIGVDRSKRFVCQKINLLEALT
jgi:hypothetical protein